MNYYGGRVNPATQFSVRGSTSNYRRGNSYMTYDESIPDVHEKELQRFRDNETTQIQELQQAREERNDERAKYTEAKNRVLTAEMEIVQLKDHLRHAGSAPIESVEKPQPQVDANRVCQLCFDREINAAFTCGHTSCYECGLQTLDTINCCAFCKKMDVQIIKLYT